MSSEFQRSTLGGLITFANGKSSPERYENGRFPVFGSNGLIGRANEANSPKESIIVGRVGSYCGSVHFSDKPCWVTDNAIRGTAKNDNDPSFLFYLLKQLNLNNWRSGSGQPLINQATLNAIEVRVPPPFAQKSIGEFIGNLDDRITLLRETNATLEAIAQALFKSWFVDFDPVRAKQEGGSPEGMDEATAALFPDSFDESELGLVPRGWRCVPLVDAYEINPQRKLKKGEIASYLDMASVPTSGHCSEQVIQREMGSGSKFTNGDTLLARITPCLENGKSGFVDFLADNEIGWGSTEFLVLRPKQPLPEYHAYLLCRHKAFRDFAIQSMSGTSGRQRIQNDVLGRYLLVLPSTSVAESFGNIVTPIQQRIAANHSQAQTLAALRDTLLPRLISGQLRLPAVEALLESV